MKNYEDVPVSEQELEDIVRRYAGKIEEGLVYVDHQKTFGGGRLDVLLVDSDKSLVVAELKVVQDDGMLLQALDYYDFVTTHIEAFSRLYKNHSIAVTNEVRLVLIAPSFSQTLVNRCKWLTFQPSLFTYNCLRVEGDGEIFPIFREHLVPTTPVVMEERPTIGQQLNYITDDAVRSRADAFLKEVNGLSPNVLQETTKYGVSMKIDGYVFAYLWPRRKFFHIDTYDISDEWKNFPIKTENDLINVKSLVKTAVEKRQK